MWGLRVNQDQVDMLVDGQTGLIVSLQESTTDEFFAARLHHWVARVADTRYIGPFFADRIAAGTGFHSAGARSAAIGEAIERYCGNFVARPMERGTERDLVNRKLRPLPAQEMPLFHDEQFEAPNFPFVRFTSKLQLRWMEGSSLIDGKSVHVPANFVLLNIRANLFADEPRTNFVPFSGIACGSSCEDAALAALLEVIERDATAIWWSTAKSAAALDLSTLPGISNIIGDVLPKGARVKFFDLSADIPVHTIACLYLDKVHDCIAIGFATRLQAIDAALKAAGEAAQLIQLSRSLLQPRSWIWSAPESGILHRRALRNFRPNRDYCNEFLPDFSDMTDLFHNSLYYLDRSALPAIQFLIDAPETNRIAPGRPIAGLSDLLAAFARIGYEPIAFDLTTADVREVGLFVIRVVVPGFVPNGPAAYPYLGSSRLYSGTGANRPADLRRVPMPHT